MTTEPKRPPPMYAVFNETIGSWETHGFIRRRSAEADLKSLNEGIPDQSRRIVTLVDASLPVMTEGT